MCHIGHSFLRYVKTYVQRAPVLKVALEPVKGRCAVLRVQCP